MHRRLFSSGLLLALFSSVDGPQPLAALERTPRPATLAILKITHFAKQ